MGKDGLGSKATDVAFAEALALKEAKGILKRLAKENTKALALVLIVNKSPCMLRV